MLFRLYKLSDSQLLIVEKELIREKKRRELIKNFNKKDLLNIEQQTNKNINEINIIINEETKLMLYNKFINLSKDNQDIYLTSLILHQKKNKNNIINTKWLIHRDTIKKYLKIGSDRLTNIANNVFFNKNIIYRIHGNTNKKPINKLFQDEIDGIRKFVLNLEFEWWPEELQGKEYCKVLSEETTWNNLYTKYITYKVNIEKFLSKNVISLNTFKKYFNIKCPDIILKTSKFDVCNKCIYLKNLIRNKKNTSKLDEYKKELYDHIKDAQFRRIQYQTDCKNKNVLCISFDFKQAIQIPTLVHQANMLYFSRKFNIYCFNIVHETKGEHNIRLYGENKSNKSIDEILTMIDTFIEQYKNKNLDLIFYADNCAGQNKNKYIVGYLQKLVNNDNFKIIKYKFLVSGHTHFSPDRAFGWFEKAVKNMDILSNDCIKKCFFKGCNTDSLKSVEFIDKFKNFKDYTDNNGIKHISEASEIMFIKGYYFLITNMKKFDETQKNYIKYKNEKVLIEEKEINIILSPSKLDDLKKLEVIINPNHIDDFRKTYL
jgi:hypothetical protein